MAVVVTPDALIIVRGFLFQHADVNALVGGRVYANRIPASPTWPLVRLQQVADSEVVARHFTATRVQVEGWAATLHDDGTARDVAATCRSALHDMSGWVHPEGWVSHVEEASPLTWLPDDDAGKARYLFDFRIYATPHLAS